MTQSIRTQYPAPQLLQRETNWNYFSNHTILSMIPWKQHMHFFLPTQRRNIWFRRYRILQIQVLTHSRVTPSGPACALWVSGTNSANISRNHLVTTTVNTAVPSEYLSFFAFFSHSPIVQWIKTSLECPKFHSSLGSWGGEMLSISRLDLEDWPS